MKATLQYVQGTSFFHQLNPLTKLIWALLAGILCFVCQNLYFLLAINVINIAIILNSKIGRAGKGVYKLFAVISVLLLFFTVFFNREGHMLVDHALGFITITDEGVRQGAVMVLRTLGAMLPLSMMIMLTPASALAAELVEKLHVPYKYAFAATAVLRFIPTLSREMEQIMLAQAARGCDLDTGSVIKRFSRMVPLCIPLLVSALRRTENMAVSLEVRGFGLPGRTNYKSKKATYRDGLVYGCILFGYMAAIGINLIG